MFGNLGKESCGFANEDNVSSFKVLWTINQHNSLSCLDEKVKASKSET